MFIIQCPWCGDREQSEFSCKGEAHIARPEHPETLSEAQWGDYVFFRDNVKGVTRERWVHSHGCGQWFNVMRSTISEEIFGSYKPTDQRPPLPENPA